MKFLGKKSGPNVLVYANIIIIAGFIASDSAFMESCRANCEENHQHQGNQPGLRLSDSLNEVFNQFEGQAKEWVGEALNLSSPSKAKYQQCANAGPLLNAVDSIFVVECC